MKCELCPEDKKRILYDDGAQRTKLIGGFSINLCPKHTNKWHEYMQPHPVWKEYLQVSWWVV